jgi:type IV secretory pathway TraG/TraD family ATPase VirD4
MRSYDIATIYSLQDKVLGTEQYGDIGTRAILSNLSYQIIGKTNDPESVRHYKQIVEEVKKKHVSKSFGDGLMTNGATRKTESFKETTKYKNQDFFGLRTGEFITLSDGKDRKVKFDLLPFERISLKVRNHITPQDLENNFNQILKESESLD